MILLIWMSLFSLAVADTDQLSLNQHLDQAQHFVKRGWLEDAELEYQTALELPGGPECQELHRIGAQIAWKRLDVELAMLRTQKVAALSTDPRRARAARAAAEAYARDFGYLELAGPHPGIRSRIQLEPLSPIIDPEIAGYTRQLASELREPVLLPIRIALPVGNWSLNGSEVQITGGSEHNLQLEADAIGHRAWIALQVSRLEISSGMDLWWGPEVEQLLPVAGLKFDWIQPAGALLIDLSTNLQWTRASNPAGDISHSGPDLGAGLHLGYEIPNRSPLAIRPSAGLRVQQMSAILLECREDSPSWHCTRPGSLSRPETVILADGLTFLPGIALGIDYRSRPGLAALGSGIRLSLEHANGRAAERGRAKLPGDEDLASTIEWRSEDSGFQGWRFSAQICISLAL